MKFQILEIPNSSNSKILESRIREFSENSKFLESRIPNSRNSQRIPNSRNSKFSRIPNFGIPPHSNWHYCTTQPSTGTTQSQQSHMTHVTKRHKRCHNQPRHNTCTQNVKPLLALPRLGRTGIAFPALFFAASSLPLSSRNILPICPAPSSCHKLQQLCCKTIIRQCDIVPL